MQNHLTLGSLFDGSGGLTNKSTGESLCRLLS